MKHGSLAARARRLLAAGCSLRGVLRELGVPQRTLADATGVVQPSVTQILSGPDGARRCGRVAALAVYQAAADALGVQLKEIPEVRPLLKEWAP